MTPVFLFHLFTFSPFHIKSMEILIPGLILVALMVYASTKIKKNAAAAYAEEKIDTPEFSIIKPDGFISPVEKSEFAFAAYSKDFGHDESGDTRQAWVELTVLENESLENVRANINDRASKVGSEQRLAACGLVIETKEVENDVSIDCEYRVYEKDGKIYQLAIKVQPEFRAELQKNIDTLIASFEIK